jgi:hypothetical protein
MKTGAEDVANRAANMTSDKRLQLHVRLSDAETYAMTRSLADTDWVTTQLEREIYDMTWNEQKRCKKELSIRLIEFDDWWETIIIQGLPKTIQQRVKHFGYRQIHLMSNISQ